MKEWKYDFYKKYPTYNKFYVSEGYHNVNRPYVNFIIKRCGIKERSAAILDLGCGLGGFLKCFFDAGYNNIIGIDASEESVQIAKSFGYDFVNHGDVFDFLKEDGNKYDVILALDIIEHFTHEQVIDFLFLINAKLNTGGKLVLHTPNAEGIFGSKIRYADITHELSFTQNSISQIGLYCGYKNIESFEDKPQCHSFLSILRRLLWEVLTFRFRLLHAAETGSIKVILSQNFLTVLHK